MMKLPFSVKSFWRDPDLLPKLVNLGCAVVAIGAVILSFLKPWYALPQITTESDQYFTTDSVLTIPFKLFTLGFSLIFFLMLPVFMRRNYRLGQLLLHYSLTSLSITLLFPTLLILLDDTAAGDAAWMQQQHDTLTWLGGDVFRAHSERSVESGTGVLAQDPPERLAVFRPPTSSLGIDRLNDWIWWVGYGPSWTQFAGKGWFFSVVGHLLLTACILGTYWRKNITEARWILRMGLKQVVVFCAIFFSAIGVYYASTKRLLRSAEEATAYGDYAMAERHLIRSANRMPMLMSDSGFIRQFGYTQWRQGRETSPEAQLYQVFWFDQNGYHDRAGALMNSLAEEKLPRHAERELSRHFLRVAINDLNSGKLSLSLENLARLLSREPNSVQGHFHMQLANLQAHNLSANRHANARIHTLYHGYKSKNKRGVLATSDWLLSQAELAAGNAEEAWTARKQSKGQK